MEGPPGLAVRDPGGAIGDDALKELADAVAFAQSTEDVSAIIEVCHRHGVPVVPFGRVLAEERQESLIQAISDIHSNGGFQIDLAASVASRILLSIDGV